ncbi:MAG: homocysteine S-methyltransferase family protein, partial [Oscillospiraceae bacterium]|nr:homocysteine S-methyltransferase family protein [Oscillospiraceae bacterium]
MDLQHRLGRERLICDGGLGSMLQFRGLPAGDLPSVWNITHSGVVLDIHKAYVQARCQILTTNTFGANRLKLSGYSVAQVISAGVSLAKEAAETGGAHVHVALSVGPTGKLLAPFGDLDFEAAVDIFAEMIDVGVGAGADLILIETMGDTYELKAAMLAAKESCDLPILVSFSPDASGRLLTGGDIAAAVCLIEGLGADALGFNCGLGPIQMKALLPELIKYASLPVIIRPNAGMPVLINGKTEYHVSPEEFAGHMVDIAPHAHIIGGCCGTTPAHIAKMAQACLGLAPAPVAPKSYTAVSSYAKAVMFGDDAVLIGERINPTGKPKLKQALRDGDMEYLCREGLAQVGNGADILDVNVGLPGIDEPALLAQAITSLQAVTDAALQIDTADAAAAERALRLYNGKPLLNSVSGKRESLQTTLPLVKKYGAAVVALTLDDDGIPATVEGRVEIAKRILAAADRFGISPRDVVVDALTLTVSTGGDNARVTLETMEAIRKTLGLHTVLG